MITVFYNEIAFLFQFFPLRSTKIIVNRTIKEPELQLKK